MLTNNGNKYSGENANASTPKNNEQNGNGMIKKSHTPRAVTAAQLQSQYASGKVINRGKIKPISIDEIFEISTNTARDYLKAKINAIPGRENLNVTLYTLRISERFQPFMVLMPKTVLVDHHRENGEEYDALRELFTPANKEGGRKRIKMAKEIFELIKNYTFGEIFTDIENDRSLRSRLGLTRSGIQDMKWIRRPHIERFGKGDKKVEVVGVALDPALIFSDMLAVIGARDNGMYEIEIERITRVDNTNAIYRIRRYRKDNSENEDMNINEEIARKYSSGASSRS